MTFYVGEGSDCNEWQKRKARCLGWLDILLLAEASVVVASADLAAAASVAEAQEEVGNIIEIENWKLKIENWFKV